MSSWDQANRRQKLEFGLEKQKDNQPNYQRLLSLTVLPLNYFMVTIIDKPWHLQHSSPLQNIMLNQLSYFLSFSIFLSHGCNRKTSLKFQLSQLGVLRTLTTCEHPQVKYGVRFPKFIWAPCAQLYSLAATPPSPPMHFCAHIRGRYWSAKVDDISW